jgi:hypothetical protein
MINHDQSQIWQLNEHHFNLPCSTCDPYLPVPAASRQAADMEVAAAVIDMNLSGR